jgi:hypothetical protein
MRIIYTIVSPHSVSSSTLTNDEVDEIVRLSDLLHDIDKRLQVLFTKTVNKDEHAERNLLRAEKYRIENALTALVYLRK